MGTELLMKMENLNLQKCLRSLMALMRKVTNLKPGVVLIPLKKLILFPILLLMGTAMFLVLMDPYIGIDPDNCINSDGSYSEVATDFLNQIPGYAEKSPSGNGLHIMATYIKGILKSTQTGQKRKLYLRFIKKNASFLP